MTMLGFFSCITRTFSMKCSTLKGTSGKQIMSTPSQSSLLARDVYKRQAVLSGTSRYLYELIHDKLNCKSRAIEFSTLQRCASHLASRTDVN